MEGAQILHNIQTLIPVREKWDLIHRDDECIQIGFSFMIWNKERIDVIPEDVRNYLEAHMEKVKKQIERQFFIKKCPGFNEGFQCAQNIVHSIPRISQDPFKIFLEITLPTNVCMGILDHPKTHKDQVVSIVPDIICKEIIASYTLSDVNMWVPGPDFPKSMFYTVAKFSLLAHWRKFQRYFEKYWSKVLEDHLVEYNSEMFARPFYLVMEQGCIVMRKGAVPERNRCVLS